MRLLPLLLACTTLMIASCDDDEATAPKDESKYPARRDIPTSLRKSCPNVTAPASRMAVETPYGPVPVEQSETCHITYGIYDSTGAFVTQGAQDLPATPSYYSNNIGWNGTDAAGNKVPTGVYFVFLDVYDQAGTLLQSRSYCIGVQSAS